MHTWVTFPNYLVILFLVLQQILILMTVVLICIPLRNVYISPFLPVYANIFLLPVYVFSMVNKNWTMGMIDKHSITELHP